MNNKIKQYQLLYKYSCFLILKKSFHRFINIFLFITLKKLYNGAAYRVQSSILLSKLLYLQ